MLDLSFQVYRATVIRCLVFATTGMLAGQLPNIYNVVKGRNLGGGLVGFVVASQKSQGDLLYWALYLGGMVLSGILYAAVLQRQDQLMRTGTAGGELPQLLRRIPGFIGLVIMVSLSIAAWFIPAAAYAGSAPVTAVLAALVLAIPASYVAVRLCVAYIAFVVSGDGATAAYSHSWRLTGGSVWRLSGILTIGVLILLAFWVVVGIIVGVFASIIGHGDVALIAAVSGVISIVVASATVPFYTAMGLAIFGDLRVRKEGADLEQRIAAA
ncbi:MAG: hypothetical protein JSS29_06380 [Proteobacteria bacterium]|nr:hypothetical protein [Pseudomonadota bacterium]